MAVWQEKQVDKIWLEYEILKILYRLNYSGFVLFNITAVLLKYR